jgi:hydrogenase maturation protease
MNSVLVAGIGNIFDGDDGFGVAVVHHLAASPPMEDVNVVDFGVRGLDLAYALTDGYRLAVLIDTVQRGEVPGTLYLIEPELVEPEAAGPDQAADLDEAALSPDQIDPASVLRMTRLLGGGCAHVLMVGCEPGSFGERDDGCIGLSAAVAASIDKAAAMTRAAIGDWLREHPPTRERPAYGMRIQRGIP